MALHHGYCNLNAMIPPIEAPTLSIISITDFVQSAAGKYFAVIDVAKSLLFSACFNSLSVTVCQHHQRNAIQLYLSTHGVSQSPVIVYNLCRQGHNLMCDRTC